MRAQDLRIGNLVNEYGIPTIIDSRMLQGIESANEGNKIIIDLSYIPLTEQWLLDFGFEKIRNKVDIFEIGRIRFWLGVGGRCLVYIIEENTTTGHYLPITIEYVHQLQNLYFALTGEELT